MNSIQTERFTLSIINEIDYERFITFMLTDERVTTFYYSYQGLTEIDEIRKKANKDFWKYFTHSKASNLPIWAAYQHSNNNTLIGWVGLVYSELTEQYGGQELQYMIHGDYHGKGMATEIALHTLRHAKVQLGLEKIIATVDIPNIGSTRVLEKLGFTHLGQIKAYGSAEMYLFEKLL